MPKNYRIADKNQYRDYAIIIHGDKFTGNPAEKILANDVLAVINSKSKASYPCTFELTDARHISFFNDILSKIITNKARDELINNNAEVIVATVLIESDTTPYDIALKKENTSPADPKIDQGTHKITVEVQTTPTNAADILAALATVKVIGMTSSPKFGISGKALDCTGEYFNRLLKPAVCKEITELPKLILDEAKQLINDGDLATVGTVEIGSDATEYDIILKKVSATPADPKIDQSTHKITVEVKDTPDITAKITAAIGTIKVGGTASAPVYDSSGKAITCPTDFDTATTPVICTKVKGLPSEDRPSVDDKQEMDKVLEDLKDSKTINTDNIDALKKMGADKLKDVSTETIAAFTKTIAQNPIDMSGNLDKVLDSYKQIDTATELEVANFEESIYCILHNECN